MTTTIVITFRHGDDITLKTSVPAETIAHLFEIHGVGSILNIQIISCSTDKKQMEIFFPYAVSD